MAHGALSSPSQFSDQCAVSQRSPGPPLEIHLLTVVLLSLVSSAGLLITGSEDLAVSWVPQSPDVSAERVKSEMSSGGGV